MAVFCYLASGFPSRGINKGGTAGDTGPSLWGRAVLRSLEGQSPIAAN